MKLLTTLLAACLSTSVLAKPLVVPGKPGEEKLMQYVFEELVKRSDRFDSIKHLYGQDGDPNTAKMMADLDSGQLDIAYVAGSKDLEAAHTAIYFPIYRGLLGMRLPIVKAQNSNIFSGVNSFNRMQQFVACQGKAWPDTFILEANGIKIAKSLKYPNLFPMLEGDRCDYFPRGVFEPFTEVENHKDLNLVVDKHVIVRYRMPFYFFTAKNNPELAEHFYQILLEMFEDGTYNQLFFNDPQVSESLKLAGLEKRVIFDLDNPYLTERSKQIPAKFWFDPLQGEK
ncbi:ABC transporter substrate-binding protein [Vibrio sp. SCSIO 43136]|uniref:ABC transporter substrate-binding protein n=1 Tax=Vibrio sp. SCSIO 43136 TaxID=2819101 RepID=UPI0020763A36|nr:ABC transporter substrate-binding protein [Vibrio sp. SCSIO 43136]USD67525.1 ABC transporter substrate-binding protein [Vibrio sp. SCSIO 43136]